jgi:hypothetical protein
VVIVSEIMLESPDVVKYLLLSLMSGAKWIIAWMGCGGWLRIVLMTYLSLVNEAPGRCYQGYPGLQKPTFGVPAAAAKVSPLWEW